MRRLLVFFIIFVFIFLSFSQENSKIQISGGMKYVDWPTKDDSIFCRINLGTPNTKAQNRDPFLFVFMMDFWATRELARIVDGPSENVGLINNIVDGDYVSAISFSKTAKSIHPLVKINERTRNQVKSSIRNVKTVDGIDLSSGLEKLEEQLKEVGNIDNSGKFVFLITDRYSESATFNQNMSTIKRISEEYGVNFSTFAHYKGFNEDFLIKSALETGGRSFYFDKNKIDDLESQINGEIDRIKNTATIDISLTFDLPDNFELTPMMGVKLVDDEILIDRLEMGTQNSLFFLLKNRPQKRRDIVIDLNYLDAEGVADQNEVFYFDIPVIDDKKIFNTKHAPEIIIYETHLKLWSMADLLNSNKKEDRQLISDTLDNRIISLKEYNNSLDSPILSEAIKDFSDFRDEIRNFAIENEIIIKRIKYRLLQFIYGKQK